MTYFVSNGTRNPHNQPVSQSNIFGRQYSGGYRWLYVLWGVLLCITCKRMMYIFIQLEQWCLLYFRIFHFVLRYPVLKMSLEGLYHQLSCVFIKSLCVISLMPSVLWHCWLGVRKSIRPVNIEWSDEVCVVADATASPNPIISCLI